MLGAKVSTEVAAWINALTTTGLRKQFMDGAAVISAHSASVPSSLTDAEALRSPALRDIWVAVTVAAEQMSDALRVLDQSRNIGLVARPQVDGVDAFALCRNPVGDRRPRRLSTTGYALVPSTLPASWPHRPVRDRPQARTILVPQRSRAGPGCPQVARPRPGRAAQAQRPGGAGLDRGAAGADATAATCRCRFPPARDVRRPHHHHLDEETIVTDIDNVPERLVVYRAADWPAKADSGPGRAVVA